MKLYDTNYRMGKDALKPATPGTRPGVPQHHPPAATPGAIPARSA